MAIIMIITMIALLIACTSFLVYDSITFRSKMVNDLKIKAEVIAHNSTAALNFLNNAGAEEKLRSLRADPNIIGAVMLDKEGQFFAQYVREDMSGQFVAHVFSTLDKEYDFEDNHLDLFVEIVDEDQIGSLFDISSDEEVDGDTDEIKSIIGKLYIRSDLEEYNERLWRYIQIIGVILTASLLIAFVLSSRFQRLISRPLLFLAKKAKEISVNKDYSVRIKKYTNDEVGGLIENFNGMLKEIEKQNITLDDQLHMITENNKQITDSINYAKRIQEAILPDLEKTKEKFKDLFIFYKPKDIVSGDFYWYREKDSITYIAAVDCTGHGVPGALMSMIGSNVLNGIVQENMEYSPAGMLNRLNIRVKRALKQNQSDAGSQDGMDLALCKINKEKKLLEYSGANRPLYRLSKGVYSEIKPDKFPIGGNQYDADIVFTSHEVKYEEGDVFYIFSDGYPDQFGGKNDKKFTNKRFREMLTEIHQQPMEEQIKEVESTFTVWKGETEQTDDVLVIGFRV